METPAKNVLFQTAARLFYQKGYRAVGVDTISAEAGIAKMTLYRHFPSKDDLIVAYLQESDREFWQHFEEIIAYAQGGRDQLLAFFSSLQAYTTSPACFGCPFINLAVEYPEEDYPGHQVARAHKQSVRARFVQLAEQAGARNPHQLADGLHLLMDGAYIAARMYGASPDNPAAGLEEAARLLIDSHLHG